MTTAIQQVSKIYSPEEQTRISHEIIEHLSPGLKGVSQTSPFVILIGGFQGSGKSTIAKHLQEKHQITILSTDAIRQQLVNRNIHGELFAQMVISVFKVLLITTLTKNLNIVVDANAHEKRIKEIADILNAYPAYRLKTIYLRTSEGVLLARLRSRAQVQEGYQGSIQDLLDSLKTAKMNESKYDLIVDTDPLTVAEELKVIDSFVSPLLNS